MSTAKQRAFVSWAKELRELGATQVTHGDMSVTFATARPAQAPVRVAVPTVADLLATRVREPGDGTGPEVKPLDPNSRVDRAKLRQAMLDVMTEGE